MPCLLAYAGNKGVDKRGGLMGGKSTVTLTCGIVGRSDGWSAQHLEHKWTMVGSAQAENGLWRRFACRGTCWAAQYHKPLLWHKASGTVHACTAQPLTGSANSLLNTQTRACMLRSCQQIGALKSGQQMGQQRPKVLTA